MKLGHLIVILVYWICWLSILTVGLTDNSNALVNAGYSTTAQFNSTGFSGAEIDSGGFFSGIIGIFTAMGRFFALALFGLTPLLTGTLQILFSLWTTGWTMYTIGFLIDSIWTG